MKSFRRIRSSTLACGTSSNSGNSNKGDEVSKRTSPTTSQSIGSGVFNIEGTVVDIVEFSSNFDMPTVVRDLSDRVAEFNHRDTSSISTGSFKFKSLEKTPKTTMLSVAFHRASSSFLRVSDLQIDSTVHGSLSESSDEEYPNFHHVSIEPPPGVPADPSERWVALDDGLSGQHAPIAPYAVRALAQVGHYSAFDESMWQPGDSKTIRIVSKPGWHSATWSLDADVTWPIQSSEEAQHVLVWSGEFMHGMYGSDLPVVRSAGIIDVSAEALLDLLVDSNRVKEYNKLSLGRTDLLVLQEDMSSTGPFGGITKLMRSESRPPMLRKTLLFTSLLHARELPDGSGYKIVTRAVETPGIKESSSSSVLKSEILMGVNIIQRIPGSEQDRCLLINVSHIRSPMVPMMIAKRIGVQAAANFVHDLRACCGV